MKCFDQRSKKREVDNLSSGWLWIAEPKVIVSFSDYVGDTNIWQNPGKQCKRPRRKSWASAKAIYLTSITSKVFVMNIQRYKGTRSLSSPYHWHCNTALCHNLWTAKLSAQVRLNSPLGVERMLMILDGALGNRRVLIVVHGLCKKGRACLWGPCHVKRASGDFCIFSFIRWQTVASGYQGVLPIITKSSWG